MKTKEVKTPDSWLKTAGTLSEALPYMREFAGDVNAGALPGLRSDRSELAFAIAKGLGQAGRIASALEYLRRIKPDHSNAISRVSRELGL